MIMLCSNRCAGGEPINFPLDGSCIKCEVVCLNSCSVKNDKLTLLHSLSAHNMFLITKHASPLVAIVTRRKLSLTPRFFVFNRTKFLLVEIILSL
jgi:hypothetical protein